MPMMRPRNSGGVAIWIMVLVSARKTMRPAPIAAKVTAESRKVWELAKTTSPVPNRKAVPSRTHPLRRTSPRLAAMTDPVSAPMPRDPNQRRPQKDQTEPAKDHQQPHRAVLLPGYARDILKMGAQGLGFMMGS